MVRWEIISEITVWWHNISKFVWKSCIPQNVKNLKNSTEDVQEEPQSIMKANLLKYIENFTTKKF